MTKKLTPLEHLAQLILQLEQCNARPAGTTAAAYIEAAQRYYIDYYATTAHSDQGCFALRYSLAGALGAAQDIDTLEEFLAGADNERVGAIMEEHLDTLYGRLWARCVESLHLGRDLIAKVTPRGGQASFSA